MTNLQEEYSANAFVQQVAARFRARAAQGNVTQAELAEATGISQSQVSKILRGVRVPDLEQTWSLCYVLALDINVVMAEADRYVKDRAFEFPDSILDEDGDRWA